ncbi:hypothetical protein D3C87_79410 [compost metagenome]
MIIPYTVYDSRYYSSDNDYIITEKDLDKYIKLTTITDDSSIIVENIKKWISSFDIDLIGLDNFISLTEIIEDNDLRKKLYQVSELRHRNCSISLKNHGSIVSFTSSRYYSPRDTQISNNLEKWKADGFSRIFIKIANYK